MAAHRVDRSRQPQVKQGHGQTHEPGYARQQSQPEEEGKSYAQPSCLALLMRRQLVRKNGDEDEVVYAKHDFHHHKRGQGGPDGGIGKYREYIGHGIFFAERSEEHTSELQSLMRISYAVFCLKKKNNKR